MRNGLSKLIEEFPTSYAQICMALGEAIRKDNGNALNQLIATYFSEPETINLLNGSIALYIDDEEEGHGCLPAALAVDFRAWGALQSILKLTGNPNARKDPDNPENSPTLLMMAVLNSDIDTVKLLLEVGANPNEEWINIGEDGKKNFSYSALAFATQKGLSKTANLLLDCGAIPTILAALNAARSGGGLDPILEKIITLRPELLHERGIGNGGTLLFGAIMRGNLHTIKWLVDRGADINAMIDVDDSGDTYTPLDMAVSEEIEDVAQYLRSIGGVSGGAHESQPGTGKPGLGKQEITKTVERLELLEDKFGIALSGLYASCEYRNWATPPYYLVTINFDVTSMNSNLVRRFSIKASAYNSAGQLLGASSTSINNDEFMGFCSESFSFSLDQLPEKIRLFPAV